MLFPAHVNLNQMHTFSAYERMSTALTVAQVYGVQRLCNHYAARLTPLPGPDSSRESNHRLAQITQYARQLASSPAVIGERDRQHLEAVGLTTSDNILMNQIIGFIGFQARTVALFQAGLVIRYAEYRGWIFSNLLTLRYLTLQRQPGMLHHSRSKNIPPC